MRLFLRAATIAVALLAIVVLVYAINAALGMRAHARYTGTISGLRLHGPVSILRDDRGVPHILAANDRDLFFAQGYVEGSDRLFQMDLLRRFIRGELAEVFGGAALRTDEEERAIPIRAIVAAQWARLDLPTRRILGEFSDGVNAAMRREPLPVEFRLLGYKPQPWTPEDSLAVGMAEVLDLIDDWDAIAPRDAAYRRGGLSLLRERFPLTDPCYDAPVTAGLAGMAPGDRCNRRRLNTLVSELSDARAPIGSNEWAVGANLTAHKRSLLANDPHLGLGIPGRLVFGRLTFAGISRRRRDAARITVGRLRAQRTRRMGCDGRHGDFTLGFQSARAPGRSAVGRTSRSACVLGAR